MAMTRSAGVFLPISSLPSRFGIGDFGQPARQFVDWLAAAGQHYWQLLPLTIPDSVGSPYASPSNLAGNWQLTSPELLVRAGWLPPSAIPRRDPTSEPIRHRAVARTKLRLLDRAYAMFSQDASPRERRSYAAWKRRQGQWLQRFSFYQALKDQYHGRPWWEWKKQDRRYDPTVHSLTARMRHQMDFHAFCQWIFWRQWQTLKQYANDRGIRIIGDIPFYIPFDSAAVWTQPELFEIDRLGRLQAVAGVPPDGFSDDGQRWGNPVYRWAAHRATRYRWWVDRFRAAAALYDVVRIDHFRGFVASWHIPSRAKSPRSGRWVATPGAELLRAVRRALPHTPLIAEDLGKVTPEVRRLRQRFHIPAVRVLQYAWSGLPQNIHHPDAITPDSVYYTSTHDTDTMRGWWQHAARAHERRHVRERLYRLGRLNDRFIRLAYGTRAVAVIVPIQDILNLSSDARLNRPGTKRRNWSWRVSLRRLTRQKAAAMRAMAVAADRIRA